MTVTGAGRRVLVAGLGTRYRGDDAAGLVAAERMTANAPPDAEVIGHTGDPVSLLEAWRHRSDVFVVDAVVAGGTPGAVYRLDLRAGSLTARFGRRGTHGAGLAEAVELARALGWLPARLTGYGIEGGSFTLGAGLSPAVARAVDVVCARLRRDLALTCGVTGDCR